MGGKPSGNELIEHAWRRCADVSRDAGEDPIGSAPVAEGFLVIEVPLPWPREVLRARGCPPGLAPALDRVTAAVKAVRVLGIAPDPQWSTPGRARVIGFARPHQAFARFTRVEWDIPTDFVADLIHSLADALTSASKTTLSTAMRQVGGALSGGDGIRDLLVCTHGTRDVCCASDGVPIYQLARHLATASEGTMRAWRCSHLGGHRFAPTVLDLPEGRYWAHVEPEDLIALAQRNRPAHTLARRYRGWSGLPSKLAQVAERAVFMDWGWSWTDCAISATARDTPEGSVVNLMVTGPDGVTYGYEALVEPGEAVWSLGSSGNGDLEAMSQFRLARLDDVPLTAAD